jgi:hypothetical protein
VELWVAKVRTASQVKRRTLVDEAEDSKARARAAGRQEGVVVEGGEGGVAEVEVEAEGERRRIPKNE